MRQNTCHVDKRELLGREDTSKRGTAYRIASRLNPRRHLYFFCLLCFGLEEVLEREGHGDHQERHGELQHREPDARGARAWRGSCSLGGEDVHELGGDGRGVDLPDAVLPHQLLGRLAVADVLEIGRRVLACT